MKFVQLFNHWRVAGCVVTWWALSLFLCVDESSCSVITQHDGEQTARSRGQERLGHHAAVNSNWCLISVMRTRHTDHVACWVAGPTAITPWSHTRKMWQTDDLGEVKPRSLGTSGLAFNCYSVQTLFTFICCGNSLLMHIEKPPGHFPPHLTLINILTSPRFCV